MSGREQPQGATSFLSSVFKFSVSTWVNAVILSVVAVLYTHLLSPSIYGIYDMMITASSTLMSAVALGLDHAYIRFYSEPPKGIRDEKHLAAACMSLSLASWFLISLILIFILPNQIGELFFESRQVMLIAAMCVNTLFMLVTRYFNITYRMQNNVAMFTIQSILLQFFTRAFFLVGAFYRPDLPTIVSFNIAGLGVFAVVFFAIQRRSMLPKRFEIGKKGYRPLLHYGLGIAPSSVLLYGNQLFSRIFVNAWLGNHLLGIFSSASTLSNMIGVMQGGFATFWSAFMFKSYKTEQRRIRNMHDYIMLAMMAMMCLLILATPVIFLILSGNYVEIRPIFGLMLFSPMLAIVGETTYYGIEIARKTIFNTIGTAISLVTNILLCVLLIPRFQLLGAVLALVGSSFAMFLLRTVIAQKFYRTVNSYGKTTVSLSVMAALSTASYLFDTNRLFLSTLAVMVLLFYIILYLPQYRRLLQLAAELLRSVFKKI